MGWIFILISAILFFFTAIDVTLIPRPAAWGFVCLAIGLLIGDSRPPLFRRC